MKGRKRSASVSARGVIPQLTLKMPLDAKKVKAIKRCIERGELRITVKKVNLATGKLGEAWLYD